MSDLNKAMLIGRLGSDPELRYMPDGGAVCNVSLATTESWKDKSGEKQERTEWHYLVFYRKLAEIVAEYLKKGSKIYVEGPSRTRKWQDKDGQDRYSKEVHVQELQMLDSKPKVVTDDVAPDTLPPPSEGDGGLEGDAA